MSDPYLTAYTAENLRDNGLPTQANAQVKVFESGSTSDGTNRLRVHDESAHGTSLF